MLGRNGEPRDARRGENVGGMTWMDKALSDFGWNAADTSGLPSLSLRYHAALRRTTWDSADAAMRGPRL